MKQLNEFIKKTGIYSIQDLQRDYQSNTKGHWFDPDTLRFFKSRFSEELFYQPQDNLIYFISSEKGPDDKRAYSVRSYNVLTRDIETVQDFQGFNTLNSAKNYCKKLISNQQRTEK